MKIDILFKYIFKKPPRVIVFHSVVKKNKKDIQNKFIHASINDFLEQLKYLVENYNLVSLDKIHSYLNGKNVCSNNSIAIIIDDGFSNFFENIYPLVKYYNIPIAIAISCDRIDNYQLPWDVMLSIILTKKGRNIEDSFEKMSMKLLNMNSEMRGKYINKLKFKFNKFVEDPFAVDSDLKGLTFEQIDELKHDKNILFLSHGLSHNPLNNLKVEATKEELIGSKIFIEKITNRRCNIFVYPQGKYDNRLIKLVNDVGYHFAYTIDHGLINREDNRFMLKRINIPPFSSFGEFICRISGVGVIFSKLFSIFKKTLK